MRTKTIICLALILSLMAAIAVPAGASAGTAPEIVFGYFVFEARGNAISSDTAQQAITDWATSARTGAIHVEIAGRDGQPIAAVSSGSRAYVTSDEGTACYDIVVRGDAAGTGNPGLPQITSVVRVMRLEPEQVDTYTRISADITGDGQVTLPDIVMAAKYFSNPDPEGPVCPLEPVLLAVPSYNKGDETYWRWASVVNSHLFANDQGGLTRVEYVQAYDKIVIENYSSDFELLSARAMDLELPIWGGFFAGEEHYYMFFGDTNQEESDTKEVIRCVKYDKEWNRLDQASLLGANTTVPFDAGSLRCDEYGGFLYVKTSHEMYTAYDGRNHQANVMLSIRQSDMQIVQKFTEIANLQYGYVSHSFNQLLQVDDQGRVVTFDHGDAHPRSIVMVRYTFPNETGNFMGGTLGLAQLVPFPGESGDNNTGGALGGMAITSQGYLVACNYDPEMGTNRDILISFIDSTTNEGHVSRLTETGDARTPVVAALDRKHGYVLWNSPKEDSYSDFLLHYVPYEADGTLGKEIIVEDADLSDCQPIAYNGKLVWYTTVKGAPAFYTLDSSGLTKTPVEPA